MPILEINIYYRPLFLLVTAKCYFERMRENLSILKEL